MMWGSDDFAGIQPEPLKRECHSCGRSERLDRLNLCEPCRTAYDDEQALWDAENRQDDDYAASRAYYGG
jgi:hypothetical protein